MAAPRCAPKGGWHEQIKYAMNLNYHIYYSGCQPQNVKLFLRGPLVPSCTNSFLRACRIRHILPDPEIIGVLKNRERWDFLKKRVEFKRRFAEPEEHHLCNHEAFKLSLVTAMNQRRHRSVHGASVWPLIRVSQILTFGCDQITTDGSPEPSGWWLRLNRTGLETRPHMDSGWFPKPFMVETAAFSL
jgi:hypothetical protein